MFVELIATLFAGVGCAGIAMLLNRLTGRRLPKWVMPIAAGAGMIGMTIYNEYTWYERTSARLPEGVTVAMTVEEQSWLRPWTQAWPYTKRFVAVDTGSARRNAALPDQHLLDLYFFGRWAPVNRAPLLLDCAARRSALLLDGADFGEDGAVADADWQAVPEGDPIHRIVCEA
ncbi:hypothetical protein [Vannielia litorea]|uniref:hypothetical protein n=1 Tax=Vannielia litorea TaxID=1217970 RepID=UPI001BD18847|nr:hypothetical protein [Vannielia litorea]MBS8225621.1 hypothetical protein [Vannielia litorea]